MSIIIEEIVYNPLIQIDETIEEVSFIINEMQMPGPQGIQGIQGLKGEQGIQGAPGSGVKITPWIAGTYASGDQVNHLGKDWVANAAIVAGDVPGTSIKWVERLSGYVATKTFENQLKSLYYAPAIINESDLINGYVNLSGNDAGGGADTNFKRTAYKNVVEGEVLFIKCYQNPIINIVSFYDVNNVYLSGVSGGINKTLLEIEVIVPVNAVKARFSFLSSTYSGISSLPYFMEFKKKKNIDTSFANLNKEIYEDISSIVNIDGYIGLTGNIASTDSAWKRSDYRNVSEGDTFDFYVAGYNTINCISFYDKNKVFLTGQSATGAYIPFSLFFRKIEVPANAVFARLSCKNDPLYFKIYQSSKIVDSLTKLKKSVNTLESAAVKLSLENCNFKRKQVLNSASKIVLHGDSISSSTYPWYREKIIEMTGALVYNTGTPGYTAAQCATNTDLQRIFDYNPNVIVTLIGGNDSGIAGSVGTFNGSVTGEAVVTETKVANEYNGTKFIQAVDHIMRKIKSKYDNIRVNAALIGTETEAEKTAKMDAVLKPYFIFCTTLPQKRIDSSNIFSDPLNWKRKRDAIVECSIKNKVHCVDLYATHNIDMSLEPYAPSPTDAATNNGIYTMDGLHPNKYGAYRIAEIVCDNII